MFSYFLTDEKNVGNLQRLKTVYIYSFIFFQIHKFFFFLIFKRFFFFFLLSLDLILFPFGFSQKKKQKTFQMEKSLAAPFESEEREFWGVRIFFFPPQKNCLMNLGTNFRSDFIFSKTIQKKYLSFILHQPTFFPLSISWNKRIKNQGENLFFYINLEKSRIVFFSVFAALTNFYSH